MAGKCVGGAEKEGVAGGRDGEVKGNCKLTKEMIGVEGKKEEEELKFRNRKRFPVTHTHFHIPRT